MFAKVWKKILFFILVFACLFNIIYKLVKKIPLIEELKTSAEYILNQDSQKK